MNLVLDTILLRHAHECPEVAFDVGIMNTARDTSDKAYAYILECNLLEHLSKGQFAVSFNTSVLLAYRN